MPIPLRNPLLDLSIHAFRLRPRLPRDQEQRDDQPLPARGDVDERVLGRLGREARVPVHGGRDAGFLARDGRRAAAARCVGEVAQQVFLQGEHAGGRGAGFGGLVFGHVVDVDGYEVV